MTVWEKIKSEHTDLQNMTKEQFIKMCMFYKITACDIQEEYRCTKEKTFLNVCAKYDKCCNSSEAEKCLREYLDCEVKENDMA